MIMERTELTDIPAHYHCGGYFGYKVLENRKKRIKTAQECIPINIQGLR
jgi:hypothetical protein